MTGHTRIFDQLKKKRSEDSTLLIYLCILVDWMSQIMNMKYVNMCMYICPEAFTVTKYIYDYSLYFHAFTHGVRRILRKHVVFNQFYLHSQNIVANIVAWPKWTRCIHHEIHNFSIKLSLLVIFCPKDSSSNRISSSSTLLIASLCTFRIKDPKNSYHKFSAIVWMKNVMFSHISFVVVCLLTKCWCSNSTGQLWNDNNDGARANKPVPNNEMPMFI